MKKLIDDIHRKKIASAEDTKDIYPVRDLPAKKLCIIRTNFHDFNPLKEFIKKIFNMGFWLSAKKVSGKNTSQINSSRVKKVFPYPFNLKAGHTFTRKSASKIKSSNMSYFAPCNSVTGLKVMIVDDNKESVKLLAGTISNAGLNIRTFTNPFKALDVLRCESFDLFLLNAKMPEMSGFELAGEINKTKINKDALIIFISASSDDETKIAGYNLGYCTYIDKPFNINVVRSQVLNILKTKKSKDTTNKLRESFFAMVAHDLKTPVNAEIRALELLLNDSGKFTGSNPDNEIISSLLQSAKYMKNLVYNILNKYKFENNCIMLNKSLCSMKSLIEESITEIKYLFAEKHQNITLSNKTGSCRDIFVDTAEIKRVLHNLLSNAAEYAPHNSNIELELSENMHCLMVSVKNQIGGKIPENIDNIFEKFVSFSDNSKSVNSGLGLYVAKKVIEAHQGDIRAEVIDGNFIKFTFSIPVNTDK